MVTLSFPNGYTVTLANDKKKYIAVAAFGTNTGEVFTTESAVDLMIFTLEQAEKFFPKKTFSVTDITKTISLRK
jgi:hypothetical protein